MRTLYRGRGALQKVHMWHLPGSILVVRRPLQKKMDLQGCFTLHCVALTKCVLAALTQLTQPPLT